MLGSLGAGDIRILLARAASIILALGTLAGTARARDTEVPWLAVADALRAEGTCDGTDKTAGAHRQQAFAHTAESEEGRLNYALRPRQKIALESPSGLDTLEPLLHRRVRLFKRQNSAWESAVRRAARARGRQGLVIGGIADAGFYRICTPTAMSPSGPIGYVIVCDNWKRDLLAFCQGNKQRIELNPDRELVRASLAVSHWDHIMELISDSAVLSGGILEALRQAVESARAFEAGECPDFVIGLNKLRLRRFPGAAVEEFVVFIPEQCREGKAWPLFVHCDRARFAALSRYRGRTGYIDLWWHSVTDKQVDWKSYQTLLQMLRKCISVDADRTYVTGECSNALAAVSLALNYPDHWAECWIELGNTYRYLAGNALNLPFILVNYEHEEAEYVAYFEFAAKCFEYRGCRHFASSRDRTAAQVRGIAVPRAVRERSPRRVSYTIESLRNPSAYWLTIGGREDENHLGAVDARVDGQTIRVTTDNVDAYTLNLALAPVDAHQPVRILENGRPVDTVTGPVFSRTSEKYRGAGRAKTSRLPGPLSDVFTDAYVVAWGSGGDSAVVTAAQEVARSLAGQGPCLADADLPAQLVRTHNVILVGTPDSNRWLAKVDPSMPVRIVEDRIAVGRGEYEGRDLGYMLIYPSPFSAQGYVAVFSATSARAMARLGDAYAQMKWIRPADVGVFQITADGGIKWHVLEAFNTVWTWHEKYDRPLAMVKREHPTWQWQQWLARILRRLLQTDVVVYEDPFLFGSPPPIGCMTYRDVFNTFKNYWISKVEIDGADLRDLVGSPLGGGPDPKAASRIVDGVSLITTTDHIGEKVLAVSELKDGRTYTAAMSEKCLKGELGVVPQTYRIVDQRYLIPTLTAYLEADTDRDIDAELDRFVFRMF